MYTITDQFIKPTTHAAGGMSWALMLHPEGLQCDLFVSHAWLATGSSQANSFCRPLTSPGISLILRDCTTIVE
jgi:hypothetical protein